MYVVDFKREMEEKKMENKFNEIDVATHNDNSSASHNDPKETCLEDIEDSITKLSEELAFINNEMIETSENINKGLDEFNRIKSQSDRFNKDYILDYCRKFSDSTEAYAISLNHHANNAFRYWNKFTYSYLLLLDDRHISNIEVLSKFISKFEIWKAGFNRLKKGAVSFIDKIHTFMEIEQSLSDANSTLISRLENCVQIIDAMYLSINIIISKSEIIIDSLKTE